MFLRLEETGEHVCRLMGRSWWGSEGGVEDAVLLGGCRCMALGEKGVLGQWLSGGDLQ